MAAHDYDIGVLGGGAAGLTMTSGAAQLGAKTILIEKEPVLGGDCLHYGCVPSKALIHAARVYHSMGRAAGLGLPAVQVPPVDYGRVTRRIAEVIARIQEHDSSERFCALGAEVAFGDAAFVDEHTVDLDGRRLSARSWLIATGSSQAVPALPGLAQAPFITNREVFSLPSLPESLLIMGGGAIAIEMAQAFCRLGSRVSVVQRSGQILSKEDADLAGLVQERLEREGVRFYLNAELKSASQAGGRPQLSFIDAEGEKVTLSAERLLLALGRQANLGGLNLEAAGVEYSAKGLALDQRLRTSKKHIYGAGDVTGGHQFTHAAGYEAGVALANAVLRLPRKVDYTWLPRCTFSDPELAGVGLNEKQAQAAGLQYTVWSEEFASNDRALVQGEGLGRIKLILDKDEKPLGVHILGAQAGELINEWVAVLNGKVKLSTLAGAMHPYPTLGEINKRVAGNVMAPKLFSDTVKKGLKFFFHTKGRACNSPKE